MKTEFEIGDPEGIARVVRLLHEAGPLLLGAPFRHVNSDYYLIATVDELMRAVAPFAEPGGPRLGLLVEPLEPATRRTRAAFSGSRADPALRSLVGERTLVVRLGTPAEAGSYVLLADDDDWDAFERANPPHVHVEAYRAEDLLSRSPALLLWSGQAG